jgi:hypothetical protein
MDSRWRRYCAVADELEAIRQLKARYCRFLDARDADGWRTRTIQQMTGDNAW